MSALTKEAVVWVTRQRVTVNHLRGLQRALEDERVSPNAEVRILTVTEGTPVAMPLARWRLQNGTIAPTGAIWTVDNLPDNGLLFTPITED